ncbi:MAG: hypothetical protein CL607_00165 [Anaerolineaceae bacterium]|nr:hypothetical protein [Anaerolineaceae bacterium]
MRNIASATAAILLAGIIMPTAANASTPADRPDKTTPESNIPAGKRSYQELVALFAAFDEWRTLQPVEGVIDYSQSTVKRRKEELRAFQAQLPDFAVASWDRHRQVDYLAIRAQMDLADFTLSVTKPWARDPGMYADEVQRLAYVELPLQGNELSEFRARIKAIPRYLAQARINLDSVAADYADLAIHSLSHGDGVGHGMPYRAVEPEGTIGWFADLRARATVQQPQLVADIIEAQTAIVGFKDWLVASRPEMTARAGVGREAYDWFLTNVRLMPYDSDQIVTLAERELQRHWANYTTERHRNRNLPELELPLSAEEYQEQLAGTDAKIRQWLIDEEIVSIPDYIPDSYREMGYNAPWIVRPDGPMFWEQIQFRDASPDHLHATFPGHRFDGMMAQHVSHPIRRNISDSGRTEGWGFYLEETALQLGLFDDRPRTRELIYIFGLFRAARTVGDVKMQRNEMSMAETMAYWQDWTPYLDENVARVDAGIYIRRPPGYGMTYTIGAMQLQKLLVDRRRQLGDAFSIRDFHDYLMKTGRFPVSLLRYDLTGHDDEIRKLWPHTPLAEILQKD